MEFFNDLGKRFSNVAKSVSDKTRDGVESGRLANDLRNQKNALEQLYAELGRLCYDIRLGDGDPDQAEQVFERIRRTRERIEELNDLRDALRDVRRCAACGAVMPREARFCSACGKRMPEDAPRPEPEPEPTAPAEYCETCGAQRLDGEKYCAVCGSPFEPVTDAAPEKEPEITMDISIDPEEPEPAEEREE